MNEMIERVAKALSKADGDPAVLFDYYLEHARAAIEAMREPTSEMVRYGESAGYGEIGHKLMQIDGRKFANASYRSMIDAAIRDK